jgi:hypothetical protein
VWCDFEGALRDVAYATGARDGSCELISHDERNSIAIGVLLMHMVSLVPQLRAQCRRLPRFDAGTDVAVHTHAN